MEAIILAGGYGTRVRPLTYTRPKPLLPVANRPLLQHVLDRMPPSVDTVLIPVNYLGGQIRAYFQRHPDPRVVVVDEHEPLGTGGAVKNCRAYFTGPLLVYNGDILCSIDLDAMRRAHQAKRAQATISLFPVQEPWHFGVVRCARDGRILEFVEKPKQGTEPSNLINAGHYLVDPSLLDQIPPSTFYSLEAKLFTQMAREGSPIYGYRFDGFWVDCGRPETLLEAHRQYLAHSPGNGVVGRKVAGLSRAQFRGYALGDGVRLGPQAKVERSIVLAEAQIGRGAVVQDSILGQGAVVGDGARLLHCVVADGDSVPAGATLEGQRVGLRPGD